MSRIFLTVGLPVCWTVVVIACSGFLAECDAVGACENGRNVSGVCQCFPGWSGQFCNSCSGRIKLTATKGVITDGPGNYLSYQSCSWVIDSGRPNSIVWLNLDHFATECIWDALYIFDGDNVDSPLLGSFSGFITPNKSDIGGMTRFQPSSSKDKFMLPGASFRSDGMGAVYTGRPPVRVRATSGLIYIYFYPDAAYFASGFQLSYKFASCPGDCFGGNGLCDASTLTCQCSVGWTGDDCSVPLCVDQVCESGGGNCSAVTGLCECPPGFTGSGCGRSMHWAQWQLVSTQPSAAAMGGLQWRHQGRASHTMVVHGTRFYVFGGQAANALRFYAFEPLLAFDTATSTWSVPAVRAGPTPSNRFEHTAVVHQGVMYVFGGRVDNKQPPVDELWSLDLTSAPLTWTRRTPSDDTPLPVALHTATVVDGKMIVIWGLGVDDYDQLAVQEYDIAANRWNRTLPKSSISRLATAGHSAVYSAASGLILVYGGMSRNRRLNSLLTYDPRRREWHFHAPVSAAQPFSALHSAVLGPSPTLGDLMVLIGGCQFNDGVSHRGTHCQTNTVWILDLACNKWLSAVVPDFEGISSARFGHTAASLNGAVWVFGGFDGTYRNDMLRYTFASCSAFTDKTTCLNSTSAGCVWRKADGVCVPSNFAHDSTRSYDRQFCNESCPRVSTCAACNQLANCSYDASAGCSPTTNETSPSAALCHALPEQRNFTTSSCVQCKQLGRQFNRLTRFCLPTANESALSCPDDVCRQQATCGMCIATAGCFWCPSLQSCVQTSSYEARLPYSQCLRWVSSHDVAGVCPADRCTAFRNCSLCMDAPGCGWCEDGSRTGAGSCMAGGLSGPVATNYSSWLSSPGNYTAPLCSAPAWHYTTCPPCQCNGRSTCNVNGTCFNCTDLTTGPHCEHCMPGLTGNIQVENGTCMPCMCNGHGKMCNDVTGVCTCRDYGPTGDKCERCEGGFYGNSSAGGLCFRLVHTTLNSDRSLKVNVPPYDSQRAQFLCSPQVDRRLVFTFNSNVSVRFNMTIEYSNRELVDIQYALDYKASTTYNKYVFDEHDFNFDGIDKIRVYLTDLPANETVSFELLFLYEDSIDLLIVFATFFGCFLSLLLIAMLFWYARQHISLYRARRNRQRELLTMAQRPFSTVKLMTSAQHRSKAYPLTVQPLANPDKVALCAFAIRLPGSVESCGHQSRLAIGSALLSVKKHRQFQNKARQHGPSAVRYRNSTSQQNLIQEL